MARRASDSGRVYLNRMRLASNDLPGIPDAGELFDRNGNAEAPSSRPDLIIKSPTASIDTLCDAAQQRDVARQPCHCSAARSETVQWNAIEHTAGEFDSQYANCFALA